MTRAVRASRARVLLAAGAAAALALGACRARGFSLSGTVTVSTPLRSRAQRPNSVLFVVAKNMGGVPVAVRRVVNPVFPVFYRLGAPDLLLPGGPPGGPFLIEVEENSRGDVGKLRPGDLEGRRPDPVPNGSSQADVVVNRIAR
ncbi:MAG: hypothetical protein KGL04_02920 [Elusimicrobia bacterium]|nr:hypothetical protein [Elusimicrobiota bacterium]MDE2313111.1 hypothetical protein [Elusimicrobiota bacterium]